MRVAAILAGVLATAALAFSPLPGVDAGPAVVYVDATAAGANNGTTWANAFTDLQSAMTPGAKMVWVADGTYKAAPVSRTETFTLYKGLQVYGCFAGGEGSLGQRNCAANSAILSGDLDGTNDPTFDTFRVVTVAGDADEATTLDGFTITRAFNDRNVPAGNGGGLTNAGGSPTLANLTFTKNWGNNGASFFSSGGTPQLIDSVIDGDFPLAAGVIGGNAILANVTIKNGDTTGMLVTGGNPLVDVRFENNKYGGLVVQGGSPVIEGSVFKNTTLQSSTALHIEMGNNPGTTTVRNTTFESNQYTAVKVVSGSAVLENVTFDANGDAVVNEAAGTTIDRVAFLNQAGTALQTSAAATVKNATFDNNAYDVKTIAPFAGSFELTLDNVTVNGGIQKAVTTVANGRVRARNSIFWDHTGFTGPGITVQTSLVQGGCPAGVTCPTPPLTANPLVLPLATNGGFTKSHALQANSPAVDAGSNGTCPATDQRGEPRPSDGNDDAVPTCDIGSFEHQAAVVIRFKSAATAGSEGTSPALLLIERSGPASRPASVQYEVTGGSAAVGKDYVLATGIATVESGAFAASIPLTVKEDFLNEGDETVRVTISSPSNATLGATTTTTFTIKDNEPKVRCRGVLTTMTGTPGADTIAGTAGVDVIGGLGGGDTLLGLQGNDVLCGGPGDDTLVGGAGNDRIFGQPGSDLIRALAGADDVRAGAGGDVVKGGGGDDTLRGGAGPDRVLGGAGADRLAGDGAKPDVCDGGPGVDSLFAASGCESTLRVP